MKNLLRIISVFLQFNDQYIIFLHRKISKEWFKDTLQSLAWQDNVYFMNKDVEKLYWSQIC